MRKVIENQLKIGQTDIGSIPIDLQCRDEIPQLLLGLQFIYRHRKIRHEVFRILERITPNEVDADKGRPGMDLWKILVLGTDEQNHRREKWLSEIILLKQVQGGLRISKTSFFVQGLTTLFIVIIYVYIMSPFKKYMGGNMYF